MPTKYCSLCTNKCQQKSNNQNETPSLNPSNPPTADVDEEDPVKNQLRVIFLLRKILEIPQEVCSNLLENCGDPCSWIDFCDDCSLLLQNGKVICDQMILLQKQLKMVQNKFKKQIIQELPFEEGLFTEEKLRVKETMRSFIRHGNIKHNLPLTTTAAESTVLLDTLDTSNVLGSSQCVKIELGSTFSNPFINGRNQCHSEEKDPLARDGSGNQLDTHSLVDIKEELIDYQLSQRELEFNSEINSEHMTTCQTNEDAENVNESSGHVQEEPNESLESEDSERKKTMNSRYGLRNRPIKHTNGQSPKRDASHVSKKKGKRKSKEALHTSKVMVKRRKRYAVDIPSKQFDVKGFTITNQLDRLAKRHIGKQRYECETCGKFSSCHSNLSKHKKLHTGEKPYECETCGKTFAQSSNLNQHKKRHTGEKRYKCTFCHKSFITRTEVKLHERRHTGEKPYDCKICGKLFAHSGSLRGHEKVHHGKES